METNKYLLKLIGTYNNSLKRTHRNNHYKTSLEKELFKIYNKPVNVNGYVRTKEVRGDILELRANYIKNLHYSNKTKEYNMNARETLEIQIQELKNTLKIEMNKLQPLKDNLRELEDALLNYRISNELITDLTPYNNKDIKFLRAFDSDYEEVCLPTETIEIINGKLECTSFHDGIVYYSDKYNDYMKCFYNTEYKLNIVGFLDIVLNNE